MCAGLIGDLAMGELMTENMDELSQQDGENIDNAKKQMSKEQMEKMKAAQLERVKKLAEILEHKLSIYTESLCDEEASLAFQKQITIEAEKLKGESYGLELLHAIGYVYSSKAKHYLGIKGGEMPSIFQNFKEKKHIVKELWTTIRSAMEIQQAAEMIAKAEQEGIDADEKMKLEEEVSTKVNIHLFIFF